MLLFATLLTLVQPSHAIHGSYLAESENPPQVCKVEVLTATSKVPGICSATLIKPQFLFTAAHCLDPKFWEGKITSIYVTCGNLASYGALVDSPGFPNYDSKDGYFDNDVGLIQLYQPIDPKVIPPMLIETNLPLIKNIVDLNSECRLSGFGFSDNKNQNGKPEQGVQHTVTAPTPLFIEQGESGDYAHLLFGKHYRAEMEKQLNSKLDSEIITNESNSFDHGDSGGALYCRNFRMNQQWRLVGILNQTSQSGTAQVAVLPAYPSNLKFLIDNLKQRQK